MTLVNVRNRRDLNPWTPARNFENYINQMLGACGNGECASPATKWTPALDLRETKDTYIVEADIPGMKKEDIQIEVLGNALTIKGERKSETEKEENGYHHVERTYGAFQRTVEIPGGFNADAVQAKFENGVLSVRIPKREEAKPRQVQVND